MLLLLSLLCSVALSAQVELLPYDPVAASEAVVVQGNARFSVLFDSVIRIEYSDTAKFVDEGTLAFVNRKTTVPNFTSKTVGNVLQISTPLMTLSYAIGQPFSSTTLNITVAGINQPNWHFGDVDHGNLLGTIRSLDDLGVTSLNCTQNANITVHDEGLHCQWGLVSKFGWTTDDDSDNYIVDPTTQWWSGPNPNKVDSYFFGFGKDFVGALSAYSKLGGVVAMPPRAANGVFWSRWYNMNNQDVFSLIEDYETRALPLDCYILDMDWHSKEGWGGYSFDKSLFPIPAATMAPIRARGVLTSGNLHDMDGVRPTEDQYDAFCKAIGADPAANKTIPFAIYEQKYALALEDQVLQALEKQSFGDFWWIDWQQGGAKGGCPGGKANPTILLNRLRATDKIRRGETQRGMVLARWGGLGNHRYQVGFSGDVKQVTWQNLAYQPYFSMTASNVLFGQWSHDIVGPSGDYELYSRWVQWGSVSSVMRSHDRGMASGSCSQNNPPNCGIIKVWDVPAPYFEANRAALQLRHRLLPYIYNAQRQMFETGISLMRPMYYAYPGQANAYLADENGSFPQYMLGDDILFSPIVSAGYNNDTLARQTVWLPQGVWIDGLSGAVISPSSSEGIMYERAYDVSEIPHFIKAGAVLPMLPLQVGNTIGRASQQYTELDIVLGVAPSSLDGSVTLYEDDGISTAYVTSQSYCKTVITFKQSDSGTVKTTTIDIGTCTEGKGYATFPAERTYTFRFVGLPPTSVTVNGQAGEWLYDGAKLQIVITTAPLPTSQAVSVVVVAPSGPTETALFGMEGKMRRANLAKDTLDPNWSTPGSQIVERASLSHAAATAVSLSYLAVNDVPQFNAQVSGFDALYSMAVSEINGIQPSDGLPANALVQWYSSSRSDSCLCNGQECNRVQSSGGYLQERIEGYVPTAGTPGTVLLFDYWNSKIDDNLATVEANAPSGYQAAIFTNGAVFSQSATGLVPLQLFWSDSRMDSLTVASVAGVAYAKANGYVLQNATLGYVYENSPLNGGEFESDERLTSVTPPTTAQWNRALALLSL